MASFDLGTGAAGARVMAVAGRERIALFTAEGRVERTAHTLKLGPLALRVDNGRLRFDFAGPAVVVEDGTAYLSVEHALAKAALHEAMELHAEFDALPAARTSSGGVHRDPYRTDHSSRERRQWNLRPRHRPFLDSWRNPSPRAVARLGRSLIAIGNGAFITRRMIWAAFPEAASPQAVEARALTDDEGGETESARVLDHGRWTEPGLQRLDLTPATPRRPPHRISAILRPRGEGDALELAGEVQSFVMLSRPGAAQSEF